MDELDPITLAALSKARAAHEAATGTWVSYDEDDPAAEAEQLAGDALVHLEHRRWDEARACAETAAELGEGAGQTVWREFCLLVEEAAETGRGAGPGAGDAEQGED